MRVERAGNFFITYSTLRAWVCGGDMIFLYLVSQESRELLSTLVLSYIVPLPTRARAPANPTSYFIAEILEGTIKRRLVGEIL